MADTSLFMSTHQLWIPLDGTFAYSSGRQVFFRATADAPVADVRIARANLLIFPLAPGTATVTVTAGDETGAVDSLQFRLSVLDDCPAMPDWGVVDYFPLDVGRTSRYWFDEKDDGGYWVHRKGTSEWAVTDVTCSKGTASYTVEDSRSGTATTPGGEWPISETVTRTVTVNDSLLFFDPYTLTGVPRFHGPSTPDTLKLQQGTFPDETVSLHFVRLEGLYFSGYRSSSLFLGASSSWTLTRLGN